ncbi:saccharopine dehydrogenase family protein [Dietzia sp. ANT_WB102]|uniref:saccharopine dehydrogenase family protein n=1 Tax=Dietzia sp. ANT_WB102 TaxID=2597345 RepID=UPI0011EEDB76|nr:saccharopine dehydrogenase NADP-binding domain-containing protein [Dietzia sp. ANT_WB102]KAA0918427.1 hypothetical protein FQ137_03505 [Dietzia sp. ANT_WB102]
MKLVILSAGSIAGSVARILSATPCYDELVIADIDLEKAQTIADEVGCTAAQFDAADPASIRSVIAGVDVVFNAVGPFYRFGIPIVRAAVECGVNYVDVCDEYDVAEELIRDTELDAAARAADVSIVFGMGYAPGITSLLARWATESMDSAHSVDVAIAVPYTVNMGQTINEHMLHSMSGDVAQFADGAIAHLPAWGDPKSFTFGAPFDVTTQVGYMGHPEAITLGAYLPGVENASVRFTWFEQEANRLWQQYEQLGWTSPEASDGLPMSPRRFLAHYMATPEAERRLAVESSGMPGTVIQVIAEGAIDGQSARVQFETQVIYTGQGGQDPTPHAAANAVRDMLEGQITRRGVMAPEACIDPEPFVRKVLGAVGVTLTKQVSTTTVVN